MGESIYKLGHKDCFTFAAYTKIEQWRREYNQVRPHSAKGYKPPVPEAEMLIALTPYVVQPLVVGYSPPRRHLSRNSELVYNTLSRQR